MRCLLFYLYYVTFNDDVALDCSRSVCVRTFIVAFRQKIAGTG